MDGCCTSKQDQQSCRHTHQQAQLLINISWATFGQSSGNAFHLTCSGIICVSVYVCAHLLNRWPLRILPTSIHSMCMSLFCLLNFGLYIVYLHLLLSCYQLGFESAANAIKLGTKQKEPKDQAPCMETIPRRNHSMLQASHPKMQGSKLKEPIQRPSSMEGTTERTCQQQRVCGGALYVSVVVYVEGKSLDLGVVIGLAFWAVLG